MESEHDAFVDAFQSETEQALALALAPLLLILSEPYTNPSLP